MLTLVITNLGEHFKLVMEGLEEEESNFDVSHELLSVT
jgi:hypothetical protein